MSETQADGSSEMERETKRIIDNLDGETDPGEWAASFMALFGGGTAGSSWRLEEIDEGLMITWFANAMEAASKSCHGDDSRERRWAGIELVEPPPGHVVFTPPLVGMMHQRILLESGRLEGMAQMLRIIGSEVDMKVLTREMDEMAERLRNDKPRIAHKPPSMEEIFGKGAMEAETP